MIEIDGSFGEGGGQVLRTALSLSCLLKKPFRMFNIRKGRKKPGLMPQHLACVRLLALVSGAQVSGAGVGSTVITFEPGDPKPGDYFFDIGTAGSTTLLLQAVLPPLIYAKDFSYITMTGGTHVPFSPTYNYIGEVFLPMLGRLGIKVDSSIERYGFYPKGGGKISVTVHPGRVINGISFPERGDVMSITGVSAAGRLPLSIAERQKEAAEAALADLPVSPEIEAVKADTYSPGTFVFLRIKTESCFSGFSVLGARGKRAEEVGHEAAVGLLRHFETGACLDPHLADQLVCYLSLADEASKFTTSRITGHLMTNLMTIRHFLDISYTVEGQIGQPGSVEIIP